MKKRLALYMRVKPSELPKKWQPKYKVKRIGEKDIVISWKTRDAVLKALVDGRKFVQVGHYTLMLNAIKSIDPFWGDTNIPPKPDKKTYFSAETLSPQFTAFSLQEREEWEKYFGTDKVTRRHET
ncbi:MAG: hypothetical protein AAF702_01630 [Chloroflexota bacterium]